MPKIRDLGINAIPMGNRLAGGGRLQGGCPGASPAPCPGASPAPCPGASPAPCPGRSDKDQCPNNSTIDPGCSDGPKQKKASGLSADAIAQLRQHLDHAVTNRYAQ